MNHQEIIELLPWYVNATLSQAEREIVETHLHGCAECTGEVRSLTAIRKAVIALGDQAPEPSQFLLNRALAEIENYERTRTQSGQPKAQTPRSFRDRIRAFRKSWWPATPVFARFAMAAQLALILVVGALALYQYNHPHVVYRTSAGPTGSNTGATQARARLSVRFNEKASEREIRQALGEVHGTIVDGPSAQGLYTVQLPVAPDQTDELDKAVQKLLRNRRVVTFAAQEQQDQ
jgi:anti-sigma factor RsiW